MAGELAFSYSGLHSAIDRYITSSNGIQNLDLPTKLGLARAFQAAAVAQLEEKLALGLNWCQHQNVPIRHVVVSGGVASNAFLRERFVIILLLVFNAKLTLILG
jgi:N6-L-threonylcarbamoyladenine synthase